VKTALSFNPLPPSARLALGEDALRRDCEAATEGRSPSIDDTFTWEKDVKKGYQVARCIFRSVARGAPLHAVDGGNTRTLWFPSVDDSTMVSAFADIVCSNSEHLGGVEAKAEFWPKTPATKIVLRWPLSHSVDPVQTNSESSFSSREAAKEATERWVNDTLGRMSLCPYTRSLRRAAVGLSSVGVVEGPVGVRHSCSPRKPYGVKTVDRSQLEVSTDAALLAATFWDGVTELESTSEDKLSTILIVAPSNYDTDFVRFAAACDGLIEPAVQAAGADKLIGKAWFHPLYKASTIGHHKVLPGHALPCSMVKTFVDFYYGEEVAKNAGSDVGNQNNNSEGANMEKLSMDEIAHANDEVRHTPHATVNLLRRSQLSSAKEAEAALTVKRPNAIYARNVFRIASEWKDSKSKLAE